MGIKADNWIMKQVKDHDMINPFVPDQIRELSGEKVVSYGLSSYGYDIRLHNDFKLFTNVFNAIVDPKKFDATAMIDQTMNVCTIAPNSFVLCRSVEYFKIPRNVITICIGKSTYARCGLLVNITPLEPGWEGFITLELSNTTPLPVRVYANEGIAQILFFEGDEPCNISYDDRAGKYQRQLKTTVAKV
jgi:dCTP deaminase